MSGNPLKLVKGADITNELTAIQLALNSKIDGVVQFAPDGTAAQPSFGFTNNAGTGMFNAAGVLGLATGGVLRLSTAATGASTFAAPSVGTTVTVNGLSNSFALNVTSGNSAGGAAGIVVIAGTNSSDSAVQVFNRASSAVFFNLKGDGSGTLGPTATTGASWAPSGNFTFAASGSGDCVTVNGLSGANAMRLNGGATSGQSFGLSIVAGTTSVDRALTIFNQAASTQLFSIQGDGGVVVAGATGGTQGLGTINATGMFVNGGQLFFGVPQSASTTAAVSDVGKCIVATGSITVPNSTFAAGNVFSVYNNSASPITITAGVTTMRLGGTATTGSRTLAQRGMATVWFVSGTECVVSGSGVT